MTTPLILHAAKSRMWKRNRKSNHSDNTTTSTLYFFFFSQNIPTWLLEHVDWWQNLKRWTVVIILQHKSSRNVVSLWLWWGVIMSTRLCSGSTLSVSVCSYCSRNITPFYLYRWWVFVFFKKCVRHLLSHSRSCSLRRVCVYSVTSLWSRTNIRV